MIWKLVTSSLNKVLWTIYGCVIVFLVWAIWEIIK